VLGGKSEANMAIETASGRVAPRLRRLRLSINSC
jgi:hypothetical protein